jgi:hypothetical protein
MYFDQAQLGMSREYLIKGIDDEDVRHYYNFMQKVIIIFYSTDFIKMKQFKEFLQFFSMLNNLSMPVTFLNIVKEANKKKLENSIKINANKFKFFTTRCLPFDDNTSLQLIESLFQNLTQNFNVSQV